MFKSLADIKRSMTVGSKWEGTFYGFSEPRLLGIRPVTRVQTNGVYFQTFKTVDGKPRESFFKFPKASEIVLHLDKPGFDILKNGEILLSYTLIKED